VLTLQLDVIRACEPEAPSHGVYSELRPHRSLGSTRAPACALDNLAGSSSAQTAAP